MERRLTDPRTDLVTTLGVTDSQTAAQRVERIKRLVAPFVTNRGIQRLPYRDGASGRPNLSRVDLDG